MPHVDDAHLHAYLDVREREPDADAPEHRAIERHVAECAECREQLEAVRETRARAQAILESAAPRPVDTPPFDAVLRKSRTRRRQRTYGRGLMTSPLAWAATVVLALGVGWYARELAITTPPGGGTVAVLSEGESGASAPVGAAGRREQPAEEARRASRATASADVERGVTSPSAIGGFAEPVDRLEQAAEPLGPRVDAPAEAKADAAGPGTPVDARSQIAKASAERQREEFDRAPAARAQLKAAAPVAPSRQLADLATEWTATNRRGAEEHLGSAILTVPGLGDPVFEIRGAGTPAVRTLQTLDGGQTLVLVQTRTEPRANAGLRSAAAEEVRPPEPVLGNQDDVLEAVREVGDYQVRARAAIPADSLAALLDRLR